MTVVPIDRGRQADDRHPPNSKIEEGSRYYTHPRTGERWISVTSVLEVIAKPKLPFWSAGLAAEAAMERLPMLVKASRRRPCGRTRADDSCNRCRECLQWWIESRHIAEKDEAADRGSRVHKVAEHWALTGELRPHDDDIADYVVQYLKFTKEFKVTYDASEMTVISREYGYAGTLDGVIRCGWLPPKHKEWIGRPLLMDVKTGRGIWGESALQLNAYGNAEAVLLPNGDEQPRPEVDGLITVHVRPDNYYVRPMDREPDTFGTFLSALSIWRWQEKHGGDGRGAIGRAMSKPRKKSADLASVADEPASEPAPEEAPPPARPNHLRIADADPFAVVGAPASPDDDDIPF